MTVSISLITLAAIVAYVVYRYLGMRAWHAIVCMILGFLLAETGAAPQIKSILAEIARWLGGGR